VHKKTLKEIDSGVRTRFSCSLRNGKMAFLCKVAGLDISASRIRGLVKAGRTIKYLLPDSVESYIISHKLYK
jgi:nicotinate-nucleotide adenylyltransferase